jgi:diacylglycerol O-acyltransferase / wax synthase
MHDYSDILGPVDSAFYYCDRPETPMNIGSLVIFEGKVDYEAFFQLIDSRIHQAPRYRQRVVQAPLNLGQPTWIDDPDFYIGNHIKHVRVEPPGTEAQLRELTGRLLSRMLDRSKPLWEIHFIEGLKDQTALFFKVHHCMVDGLAAVDLFTFLLDMFPDTKIPDYHKPLFDPHSLPNAKELTLDSIARDFTHRFGLFQKLGSEALRIGSVLTDADKRLKMFVAIAHLINNNLKPIKKLSINGKNTGRQTLVWSEFSLSDVHAIRATCGASVNDVMLAIMTKAVELYSEKRGGTSSQPFLRILIPVNVRSEEEKGDFGNRISVLPIDVPFHVKDPLKHLAAVKEYTKVMKESSLAYSVDLVLTLPSLMPAPMQSPIWNFAPVAFSLLAHTWCTNVAAMPFPVYLLGHEMKHVYGYFPLNPTMGLAAVIVSYNGKITMTLVADKGIVNAPDELGTHLREAFGALRTAAKVEDQPPVEVSITFEQTAIVEVQVETDHPDETEALQIDGEQTAHDEVIPVSPVPVVPVSNNGYSVNGAHADAKAGVGAPPVMVMDATPEATVTTETKVCYRLFSEGWAKAMQEVINTSEAYHRASTGWTAGSLAFAMNASPRNGFDAPVAVFLDLDRGKCRSAYALSQQEALKKAAFVIQGDYAAWMDVLHGKVSPLAMLTSGKLQLKKGSMFRLLPYTRSATELVHCAQKVPWE